MPGQSILQDREAVTRAVREAGSIREALEALGLRPAGGNYQAFHRACHRFGLDAPAFRPGPRSGRAGISWPPDEQLRLLVAATSYAGAARQLGVSDTAVRKRLRRVPGTQGRLPASNRRPAPYKGAALPAELRRPAVSWAALAVAILSAAGAAGGRAIALAVLAGSAGELAIAAGACLLVLLAAVA
jgi:hypothetical protein